MGYAELTTEQRASLDAWMTLFRAVCGELARMNNHAEVVDTDYDGTVAPDVLADLVDADIIPVTGGLHGAEPMTKAQVVTVMSYMQGTLAYNGSFHRQNLARAAGESNLIG